MRIWDKPKNIVLPKNKVVLMRGHNEGNLTLFFKKTQLHTKHEKGTNKSATRTRTGRGPSYR